MPRPKLVRSAIPGPGWLVAALLASTVACHADEQTAPTDLVGGSDAGGGGLTPSEVGSEIYACGVE